MKGLIPIVEAVVDVGLFTPFDSDEFPEKARLRDIPIASFSDWNFPTMGAKPKLWLEDFWRVLVPSSFLLVEELMPKLPPTNTWPFKFMQTKDKKANNKMWYDFIDLILENAYSLVFQLTPVSDSDYRSVVNAITTIIGPYYIIFPLLSFSSRTVISQLHILKKFWAL